MEPVAHAVASHQTEPLRAVPSAHTLTVSVVYHLSESGRKALLLSGGDGKGVQRLAVQIPATRLHLVSVGVGGQARLKLQPRFERADGQVVRHDNPPTYDAPPTIDDLFREAARNHELEREFRAERALSRDRRRDADRERRLELAHGFLGDSSQRAMAHPVPTPKRCFLATASGRVMFDAATDIGPAREVPAEACRRFRADLRVRRERNLERRTQELALHQDKMRTVCEWVTQHGSDDQRERLAAGLLPTEEVVDALTAEAFAAVDDVTRYPLDGPARLQAHLRAVTGRSDLVVLPSELHVLGADAASASAGQWAMMRALQSRLPDAEVTLREHRLSWRRDSNLAGLSVFGVLVTRQVGPFILRREFAAPEVPRTTI